MRLPFITEFDKSITDRKEDIKNAKGVRWWVILLYFLFIAGAIIYALLGVLALLRSAFPTSSSSISVQTMNFYNQTSSSPSSLSDASFSEDIQLTSSTHTTLNEVFNLLPVILYPAGQPVVFQPTQLTTSTQESDGLYHSVLELDVLVVPNLATSTLQSVTPPNGATCDLPSLSAFGTMLGGQFTGRIDYRYKINCVSNIPFTSTTSFQVVHYNTVQS
ncbi:MAG TPA: hypothetical protein VIJ29_00910 [Candidatus Paceibacterota bacterium]